MCSHDPKCSSAIGWCIFWSNGHQMAARQRHFMLVVAAAVYTSNRNRTIFCTYDNDDICHTCALRTHANTLEHTYTHTLALARSIWLICGKYHEQWKQIINTKIDYENVVVHLIWIRTKYAPTFGISTPLECWPNGEHWIYFQWSIFIVIIFYLCSPFLFWIEKRQIGRLLHYIVVRTARNSKNHARNIWMSCVNGKRLCRTWVNENSMETCAFPKGMN